MNDPTKYRDSLFRMLFTNPDEIRQLYNALGHTSYGEGVPIEIKTIPDTAYADIKNDLAFTIDNRFVVMVEHQSTINKNMPYRMLRYFERVMRTVFPNDETYHENTTKFPTPEFYVLYNGSKKLPEESVLKLSDSFLAQSKENSIELVVKVLNVRYNKDAQILKECKVLREYSILIDTIEHNISLGYAKKNSIEMAVDECIEKDILKEFLLKNKEEVIDCMYGDISYEKFVEIRAKEQYEIGLNEGISQGLSQGISQGINSMVAAMKADGLSIEHIARITKLSKEQIENL